MEIGNFVVHIDSRWDYSILIWAWICCKHNNEQGHKEKNGVQMTTSAGRSLKSHFICYLSEFLN